MLLVNAYREDHTGTILWDYDQENPLADARGFQVDGEKYTPNQQENIARNKTLVNGARYYVDHAHPEYSCPEVTNPRELVIHEKAGERIVEISRREANALLPAGTQMLIYKNNSDRKGNSYGCHENYLMDRRTSFKQIVEHLMPFFVTRQVYTGAGKVGTENRAHPCDYQLSQRADFFETEVALDTMVKRPIINTRDEPHADREKYRRLHVIVGDSNMARADDLPAQRRDGDRAGDDRGRRDRPRSHAARPGARDQGGLARPDLPRRQSSCSSGRKLHRGPAPAGIPGAGAAATTRAASGRWTGDGARRAGAACSTPSSASRGSSPARSTGWRSMVMIESFMERKGVDWRSPQVQMLDLQYHDIRPEKGLYYLLERQGKMERLASDEEIKDAITQPPEDTRAYFRGRCLRKYGDQVFGVNWDSISFGIGDEPIKRVMMAEPLKGTKAHVEELLRATRTDASELVRNLRA